MDDYIDIYCERIDYGFWAEPINAITNAAFLMAAALAAHQARKFKVLDAPIVGMILILTAIGIGSFLFHTLATPWAMLADTTPILLFQIGFLGLYAVWVMKYRFIGTGILLGLFFVLIAGFGGLQSWMSSAFGFALNGSLGYIPALLFLIGLGIYHRLHFKFEEYKLLIAAGVFAVSLTFRSVDNLICPYMWIGTHFVWHCLNAIVLYLCLRVLIANRARVDM